MKKALLIILTVIIILPAVAQKSKPEGKKPRSVRDIEKKDSISDLPDSAYFVSNIDIAIMDQVIKQVLSSQQFIQATDPITRWQMLTTAINAYVLLPARKRWEKQIPAGDSPAKPKEELHNNKRE